MESNAWTIKRVIDWTRGDLERHGDEHPRLSAEWLLSAVTGKSRVQLYLDYDQPLEPAELAAMRAAIQRRRAGEPLQYVTGEMPFRHIVIHCERGVLIPRPETEVLVDAALEGVAAARARRPEPEPEPEETAPEKDAPDAGDVPETGDAPEGDPAHTEGAPAGPDPATVPDSWVRVADICCGTGCIALSIAGETEASAVWAGDLSPAAVALTVRNRDALGLGDRVAVAEGDLYGALPEELMGTLDVVVSNPPYIPSAVVPTLPDEVVGFEPGLALDGGPDGLDIFRRLLEGAPAWLAPGGMLCVELFEESLDDACALVRAQGGWASVEARDDLAGRPRVLVAVREG
ncbi:N5-glutamine methyltransferase family protein [Caniella muris]|uniref:N5-glutamine methyltransferase family protein n=1 Tax=Caniella muris TaxID=2941502 RepID=UPI00203C69F6|nr:HemK/PrmC family methyltransferase [Caniella muris]